VNHPHAMQISSSIRTSRPCRLKLQRSSLRDHTLGSPGLLHLQCWRPTRPRTERPRSWPTLPLVALTQSPRGSSIHDESFSSAHEAKSCRLWLKACSTQEALGPQPISREICFVAQAPPPVSLANPPRVMPTRSSDLACPTHYLRRPRQRRRRWIISARLAKAQPMHEARQLWAPQPFERQLKHELTLGRGAKY
jgi:hypothetical protein